MKRNKALVWSLLVPAVLIITPVFSQDDLYYDPSTDASSKPAYNDSYREDNNVTRQYHEDDYYDEDEYAYEYSSRIRRFHRPVQTIDYYDPFFVDMWYYDPFFMPGASIYIGGYNDYWRWRRWNRWQRFNTWAFHDPWGWGNPYNSWGWGWNRPWGWGAWNNPYVFNNYYYDPYWTWNGYNPYYCPGNVWVNSNYYYNNTGGFNNGGGGYTPRTYTGPRRGGTTVNPGYARLTTNDKDRATPNRLVANDGKSPVIELPTRPNGRNTTKSTRGPEPAGATDRSGVNRPTRSTTDPARTDRPARDVTPSRNDRPARDVTPERETRPNRDVTPSRNDRPARDVTPERETRPSRDATPNRNDRPARDVTPNRDTRPSRETTPDRGGNIDERRSSDLRPARRAEPSYDRPSRSEPSYDRPSRSNNDRGSFQPSRSSDSGSRSSSGSNSSGSSRSSDSGSRSSSGSSGRGGRN